MPTLLGLPYSPWTEKARFSLDARKIAYTFRTYQPLLGEPALRIAQRELAGPVSVPILTTDEGAVIADSAQIARWADRRGEGPALFPIEHDAEIDRVVALSERALGAGRALSLGRMLEDHAALMEMVPRPVARVAGGAAATIAALGIRRTLRKYGASGRTRDQHERVLDDALEELRRRLGAEASAGPATILGAFTFADIAAAQALSFVSPPARGLRIAKASRRAFTDAHFAERYRDLLDWRDALYAKWRPDPIAARA